MSDRYTKFLLTVIAVCLILMVARDWSIAEKAEATSVTHVYIEDVNPGIRARLPVRIEGAFRPVLGPQE